jgi:ribonuclease HI
MKITIYTDGSSRGNPGPGGWGAIIMTPTEIIEIGGREKISTNNRMEMMAAIKGLQEVGKEVKEVEVCTDSEYVKKGITEWVHGWIKRGWKGATKKPVINKDLWEMLKHEEDRLKNSGVDVKWKYVPAHVGILMNERADTIATMCADDAKELKLYRGPRNEYAV